MFKTVIFAKFFLDLLREHKINIYLVLIKRVLLYLLAKRVPTLSVVAPHYYSIRLHCKLPFVCTYLTFSNTKYWVLISFICITNYETLLLKSVEQVLFLELLEVFFFHYEYFYIHAIMCIIEIWFIEVQYKLQGRE